MMSFRKEGLGRDSPIASASVSLFVVDPYIDETIFDAYMTSVAKGVKVRLMSKKISANLKQAAEVFTVQHGVSSELRGSRAFHDRAVFVDGADCSVLGQSVGNAAKSMPTYLAPLSPDIASDKLAFYEDIWKAATPI